MEHTLENVTSDEEGSQLDAVFLYMGILDAYEAVGVELIGPDVLEDHVLPRMVYYVREFLPDVFSDRANEQDLTTELQSFLADFRQRVDNARESGTAEGLNMEDIWKLRAAIFGFESVFINILGEAAIKDYVFIRIADILSAYLPDNLLDPNSPLENKLREYAKFLTNHDFVRFARVESKGDTIVVATNNCAFSRIHDSEAYTNLNVRFCPWGMIGSAIVAAHEGKETVLESSLFTTRGSVSKIAKK
jgi:hypothetical protein